MLIFTPTLSLFLLGAYNLLVYNFNQHSNFDSLFLTGVLFLLDFYNFHQHSNFYWASIILHQHSNFLLRAYNLPLYFYWVPINLHNTQIFMVHCYTNTQIFTANISRSPAGDQFLSGEDVSSVLRDDCLQLLAEDHGTQIWHHHLWFLLLSHPL